MAGRPEVKTVLSTLPWRPEEIDQIRRAFEPAVFVQCDRSDRPAIRTALQRAQIAVLAGDLDDDVLKAPHLVWVHCDHAGLNRSARPDVFARGLIVTSSAGRSAPALAQHAFFFALALAYDVRGLLARQASRTWNGGDALRERGALWGRRLGIVGFGHTGREMARMGRAFGMHVTVLRRRVQAPAGEDNAAAQEGDVDVMLSTEAGDGLDLVLESDVVMLAAGLSDQTYHLFGSEQFRRMKKTAVIVNMARGALVDEEALVEALKAGEIAGAGLDVFETEPLQDDSPLWDLPNVLITPHATPQMPDRTQRSINIIMENIRRYRDGRPMLNAIDKRDLFTKG